MVLIGKMNKYIFNNYLIRGQELLKNYETDN